MARNITTNLYQEFENRLRGNASATAHIAAGNPRGLLLDAARAFIGTHEEGGNNRGLWVEEFQHTVGVAPGEAWCMCFVQSCIAYVEKKMGFVSPIYASGGCLDVWNNTNPAYRVLYVPLGGAIAIWKHLNGDGTGHTGFVVDCDGHMFHSIEGNTAPSQQSNGVIVSDGDGVYPNTRNWNPGKPPADGQGDKQLLGALKPF